MAVSINLLPKERQEVLTDKRNRGLAIGLSLLIGGGLIGVTVVLFVITTAQGLAISRQQSSINAKIDQLKATKNLQEMVTIQRNLKSLPELYRQRRLVGRVIARLQKRLPTGITLGNLSFTAENQLEVSGTSNETRLIKKFARKLQGDTEAYSSVELGGVSRQGREFNFTLKVQVSDSITRVNQ